jgi:uncharacterized protein YdhG (YjbR/CyaY superfamily)
MNTKQKPAQSAPAKKKSYAGFSDEEKAAMQETVRERKLGDKANGESAVLAKIAEMPPADRAIAKRLHAVIKTNAPDLTPKTWYGMPAYARGDKIVCFFQGAYKFKARYATLGFSDAAHLDDGDMWPNSYALTKLSDADETRIIALLKKAMS